MKSKRVFLSIVIIGFLAISAIPAVAAESAKPWYAATFEKLGFYVFDPPYPFQDFKVTTLSGDSKTRTSSKGKIVLLNFWATWCPPCREEVPGIEKLSVAMKGKNFEVFAVTEGDDLATVKSFIAEQKLSFPIYLDPKGILSRTYASQGIPTTYVLDKDGHFIAGMVGGFDYTNPTLVNLLNELAAK
jgi:thiol-disulfide isomerase/thioredoxin